MAGTNPETLAYFAPGLLHQFGNLFLSIQGCAHLLSPNDVDRGRTAILGAADRGASCLDMMRYLAGEPAASALPLPLVLERFAELARVPLREGHQALDVRIPTASAAPPLVDPADVVVLAGEAVRRLATSVPSGVEGRVVVEWSGSAPGATAAAIAVRFEGRAGTLPFPLRDDELHRAIAEVATSRRSGVACGRARMGVTLEFPAHGAAKTAEA